MKILSMFVTPRRGGHMAVVATVQHRDGHVATFALDPTIADDHAATIYGRKIEAFAEWAASPLELGWGAAGPIVGGPPPPPKGPGGDGLIAIPEPVIAACRALWVTYQRISVDVAGHDAIG